MTEGLRILLEIVGLVISAGVGAWLLRYLSFRADREDKRTEAQTGRERSLIAEYQHILDDKDTEAQRAREDWKTERGRLEKENAYLRRAAQTNLIDMEQMRMRIDGLNREIVRVSGVERSALGDVLDSVVFTDDRGDIYWANETASLFLRRSLEQLYTMNVRDLVPASLRGAHDRGMQQIRQRGPQPRGVLMERALRGRFLRNDGAEIPADIYVCSFAIGSVIVCRAQLRRRFERTETEDVYFPAAASASGIAVAPAVQAIDSGAITPPVVGPPAQPLLPPDDPARKRFR